STSRIRCEYLGSAVTLTLFNAAHSVVGLPVTGQSGGSTVSLNTRAKGGYYIRATTAAQATTPVYSLAFTMPQSAPPVIQTLTPEEGNITLQHGVDTLTVDWTVSDPDGDPTWVTVYLNEKPELDGNQILIPTSLHTAGTLGSAVVNSTYVPPGMYWV